MVKAIFFDMWGTLVENGVRPSPLRQVLNLLRVRMPFPIFVTRFERVFMTKRYHTHLEGFEAAAEELGVNPPRFVYDKLVGLWNKFMILSKPYPETLDLLARLKENYKLVLISNTDAINGEQVLEKYDLRKYFDVVQLSYEAGLLKSDPEFFTQPLEKLDLKPEEVVMVGDSLESDIENARQVGIKGVLIDRRGMRDYEPKIRSLDELEDWLEAADE